MSIMEDFVGLGVSDGVTRAKRKKSKVLFVSQFSLYYSFVNYFDVFASFYTVCDFSWDNHHCSLHYHWSFRNVHRINVITVLDRGKVEWVLLFVLLPPFSHLFSET